jgi:outer membrane protein
MKMKLMFSAILTSAMLAGIAHAESLSDAMALAYVSNPLLQAERAGLRATDEQLAQARARRLPSAQLDASYGYSKVKQASPFFSDTSGFRPRSAGFGLNQTLYGGGGIKGGIDAARANIEAGRANLVGVEQTVLLDAATAYLDVLRDMDVVEIRKNNVAVLDRQRQAAQDRFDVGEITRTNVSQAVARVAGARAQLQAALSTLANSRAAYERVVGRMPGTLQSVATPENIPQDLQSAREIAGAESPVIRAAMHAEEAARQQIKVAKATLRPNVTLGVNGSSARNGGFPGQKVDSLSSAARLSIPIFTGGLSQSQTRAARQRASQARLQLAQTRRQVNEQVARSWSALIAAQAVILSSQEQVKANELAFEGVEQEAQVGLRTTLDVLDAEQELLNARVTLVSAEHDASLAAYGLLATTGQLTARKLALPVAYYDPVSYGKTTARGLFDAGINE